MNVIICIFKSTNVKDCLVLKICVHLYTFDTSAKNYIILIY